MWCHSYIPLGINPNFFGLSLCERQIVYALRTRTPVEARKLLPRLACVRPAASVHPEPGSNSSSLKSLISFNRFLSYWLQVSLDSLNLFVLYNIMSMYVLFILARALIVSFAGAKVRRFLNPANFLNTFLRKKLQMIDFDRVIFRWKCLW